MLVGAFLILALLAGVLVYQVLVRGGAAASGRRAEGFFSETPEKQRLVFLYMTGCGWCDRFKPQWAAFEDRYGEALQRRGIALVAFERSDPAAQGYLAHADGFPTVLLVSGNGAKVRKFEGDRTPEGLMAFVTEHGGGPVSEGFDDAAPRTEFDAISRTISKTREKQKDSYKDQQSNIQSNAGGNLEKFGQFRT